MEIGYKELKPGYIEAIKSFTKKWGTTRPGDINVVKKTLDTGMYAGQDYMGLLNSKNQPHDRGIIKLSTGIYDGNWKDGEIDGVGKIIFTNNNVYEGHFKTHDVNGSRNAVQEGNGVMTYMPRDSDNDTSISSYNGEWKNNQWDGLGILTYKNGDKERGKWIDGLPNGKITMIFVNGDIEIGNYKMGRKHGKFETKKKDGKCCTKNFVMDVSEDDTCGTCENLMFGWTIPDFYPTPGGKRKSKRRKKQKIKRRRTRSKR